MVSRPTRLNRTAVTDRCGHVADVSSRDKRKRAGRVQQNKVDYYVVKQPTMEGEKGTKQQTPPAVSIVYSEVSGVLLSRRYY